MKIEEILLQLKNEILSQYEAKNLKASGNFQRQLQILKKSETHYQLIAPYYSCKPLPTFSTLLLLQILSTFSTLLRIHLRTIIKSLHITTYIPANIISRCTSLLLQKRCQVIAPSYYTHNQYYTYISTDHSYFNSPHTTQHRFLITTIATLSNYLQKWKKKLINVQCRTLNSVLQNL